MNDTGYKLVLDAAKAGVYYAGSRVGTIVLREAVEVPRRTTDSFRTLWRLKISDPWRFTCWPGRYGRATCRRSRCRMPWKGAEARLP